MSQITIDKEELDNLKERLRKLAIEKSYLQLVSNLVTNISSGTGLDSTIDNLLKTVMNNIGGSNVIIYYRIGDDCFSTDVFGNKRKFSCMEDPDIMKVLETSEPIEKVYDFGKTRMTTPGLKNSITWIFPLIAANKVIGVLKIEDIVISLSETQNLLGLFFNYAALILYNEINNFSKLKESHDELRISHEKLILSEERFKSTLETMLEGCVIIGFDWTYIYVNDANAQQARMKREEMIGRTLFDLFPGIESSPFYTVYKKCMDERIPDQIESSFVFPDNTLGWFEVRIAPVPEGIFLLTLERTKRKKAERELKESEEKFLLLLNSSAEGIYGINNSGNCTFCNRSALHILGYPTLGEVIGQNMHTLIHHTRKDGTFFPNEECKIYKAFREGIGTHVTDEVLWKKDGTSFPAEYWSYPIIQNGEVKGSVVTFFDISERLKSEDDLRKSEEKYRLITENTSDVIWILNLTQEKFIYISPSIIQLRGYTPKEAMAQSLEESLVPESLTLIREELKAFLPEFLQHKNTNLTHRLNEIRQPCKNGSIIWVEVASQLQFNAAGEIEVLGVSRNIEERKKMEYELQRNAMELRELNATKDKIFSIIAHDLKSPFNSILGFSDYLVDNIVKLDNEAIARIGNNIYSASKNVFNLLENLLLWANTQTGRISFQPGQLNLKESAEQAIKLAEGSARRKGIRIAWNIPENIIVIADRNMLETILRNLISNAIKYTRKDGNITVSAREVNNKAEISVRDDGVGIKTSDLPLLFQTGRMTSTPGTDKEKGTGLGLTLCKEFVDRHGGMIWTESEEGKGTTFYFTLDLSRE